MPARWFIRVFLRVFRAVILLPGLTGIAIGGCGIMETLPTEAMKGGGCGTAFQPPVTPEQYRPGSYRNRSFLSPPEHVGGDTAHREGTPITSIGPGKIVWYGPASGYGELTVVIEHDLLKPQPFPNGNGQIRRTRFFISIYGHLRPSKNRGGARLPWKVGDLVQIGDLIGYVNDDAHNGDGAEHLHFGIRLVSAEEAKAIDPGKWFRGYDYQGIHRETFASPDLVLASLKEIFENCEEESPCEESQGNEDIPSAPEPTPDPEPALPDQQPPASVRQITCLVSQGMLEITVNGSLTAALVGEALPSIAFLSIGSNETGWATSTSPPRYFIPWNGDQYPHTLRAPASVNRFNLWAGGSAGARWFDLSKWQAGGANCRIMADGLGGLVVVR